MIKWITRLLLLFQLAIAIAIFFALTKTAYVTNTLGAAIASVLVVLSVRAFITANNFFIAGTYGEPIFGLTALSRLQWLRLFGQEFIATMVSSSWTMPFHTFGARLVQQPRGLPVLLIHGYGCNSGYWHTMSKMLAAHGISHRAVDLEPVFGDIDDYVAIIDRGVATLRAETGQNQIILVGHSMGGLAARAYIRDHGHVHISKVITLGTPHHGTGLANFGVGANTRQMGWQPNGSSGAPSEWLSTLDAKEAREMRRLFVSIYSTHDNIVSPRASSFLEGAKNVELHAIGHVAMALTPEVQAQVIAEIDEASRRSLASH